MNKGISYTLLILIALLIGISDSHAYYARYCGHNEHGEGGLGNKATQLFFEQLSVSGIKKVACGKDHTLLLTTDGKVYACGRNDHGQLGLGSGVDEALYPTYVSQITNFVRDIACGDYHSLVLTDEFSLYAFGLNTDGQLGAGDWDNRYDPYLTCHSGYFVVEIDCGSRFSAYRSGSGSIYTCGDNEYGQLAIGNNSDRNMWQQAYDENAQGVECGAYHIVMIFGNNIAVAGRNDDGQLGLGDTENRNNEEWILRVVHGLNMVACGQAHTLFLRDDGKVYACGNNSYGELGLGHNTDCSTPTLLSGLLHPALAVYAGGHHSMFLLDDGILHVCGRNNYGQLGLNDTTQRNSPTRLYGLHSIVDVSLGWYNSMIVMPTLRRAPNDYDGDGQSDIAIYYKYSTPNWYIRRSSQPAPPVEMDLGWDTFLPVTGDYDGDGLADPAIYNPDTGNWFIDYSTASLDIINWGWDQSIPVPADYHSDGFTDIAVYWPAGGEWYIRFSEGEAPWVVDWGWADSQPLGGCY
jgi:alpha-tubulin suppressor-like RCC1 family protein